MDKTIFKNTTAGYVGAITISTRGDEKAVAVAPGAEIALSIEEEEATANAPRDPRDNPFLPSSTDQRDPETGALIEAGVTPMLERVNESRPIGSHRPIGSTREETGAPPAPAGPAPEGSFAQGEEVGDPTAATAG
jgi:hypothetical protein